MDDVILLDGVKYTRYELKSEAEFRQLVVDNIAEVFGEEAIYIDIERNLKNELGKARRPDGFILDLKDDTFYVVEFELSIHSTYGHIDPQINGFLQAVDNWNTRQKIAGILQDYMLDDIVRQKALRDHIGESKEIYRYFIEKILTPMHESGQPNTYMIIDECCKELQIAMRHRMPRPKIIEVAVYAREGAENVKMLRFKPEYETPKLYVSPKIEKIKPINLPDEKATGKIEFPVPVFADYKGQHFDGKLFADGSIEFNGKKYKSPSGAGKAIRNGKQVNGWDFWRLSEERGADSIQKIREKIENK